MLGLKFIHVSNSCNRRVSYGRRRAPPGFLVVTSQTWSHDSYDCRAVAVLTVGQRKKVTAVTFFPARPRPDQRGTNTGQIRKVPVHEIACFLLYRMGETRSQLSANNGILVCLVQEIWQFKLFAGKEVTAVPATRGEGGYWRRGRRLLCLCWNWIAFSFLKHWK